MHQRHLPHQTRGKRVNLVPKTNTVASGEKCRILIKRAFYPKSEHKPFYAEGRPDAKLAKVLRDLFTTF